MPWAPLGAGKIWEFLRSELEMDGRFKTLESKLNLIQDNLKVSAAAACSLCRSGPRPSAWSSKHREGRCSSGIGGVWYGRAPRGWRWDCRPPPATPPLHGAGWPQQRGHAACVAELPFLSPHSPPTFLQYFLEILQNRKSDTLEWTIIVLIGAEICLSLYDLFTKGL
jgi:hypothetical protein